MPDMRYIFLVPLLVFLVCGCEREITVTSTSQEALRFYTTGLANWENFYYTDAERDFKKAIDLDSTFGMAWGRLAILNFNTNNEAEAKRTIQKAVDFASHLTLREQLYIRMWQHRIMFRNKEAAQVADSIVMLYPRDKEGFVALGFCYEIGKNLEAAVRSYQKAIDIDTSYAHAVMLLGYAYSALGEQEKAIAQMQRYIRLSPNAADPRASYADLLLRVGRYDDALEQYSMSLKLKQDYWYAITKIGDIYLVLGRLRDAAAQYSRGVKLLPHSAQRDAAEIANSGFLDYKRGRYEQAIATYQHALTLDPANGVAAFGLVYCFTKLAKFKEADYTMDRIRDEFHRRGMEGTGAMQGFHVLHSFVLMHQGRLDEAQQACDSALEFSSPLSRSTVFRQLAEVHLRRGEYESALDACEEALRTNSNWPEALLTLARIYHASGDKRMTREIGGRLLDLWKNADPDFQDLQEVKRMMSSASRSASLPPATPRPTYSGS
jgi:tetratricopeptide (TPR) repeat protein